MWVAACQWRHFAVRWGPGTLLTDKMQWTLTTQTDTKPRPCQSATNSCRYVHGLPHVAFATLQQFELQSAMSHKNSKEIEEYEHTCKPETAGGPSPQPAR